MDCGDWQVREIMPGAKQAMLEDKASFWRPVAGRQMLERRAEMLARIRRFFAARQVLEVETPILTQAPDSNPNLHVFKTVYQGPGSLQGKYLYLQSSPEFAMKRLLAAGSGCIYQIARVFRNGELGRRHNPEFTLLEWYRLGFDHHRLIGEIETLVRELLSDQRSLAPTERLSYRDIFWYRWGLDPHRAAVDELRACVLDQGLPVPPGMPVDDRDPWLDLLLSLCIEPHLGQGRLTFVYDYPVTQAALAQVRPGDPPVAERFELYLDGIELANGFHELTDVDEQRRRLREDNRLRADRGLSTLPEPDYLLAALGHGLPDCAGVALGLDRLLMAAFGASSLVEVLAFPVEQA